eukprot:1353873-Amorphochlora_amoeboformis.AAC.2
MEFHFSRVIEDLLRLGGDMCRFFDDSRVNIDASGEVGGFNRRHRHRATGCNPRAHASKTAHAHHKPSY